MHLRIFSRSARTLRQTFVQQEIELIEVVVIAAINQEIGRTTADPHRRFDEIKQAVERSVDVNAWRQKFAGDDPNDRDFFEVFAGPGLLRQRTRRCGLARPTRIAIPVWRKLSPSTQAGIVTNLFCSTGRRNCAPGTLSKNSGRGGAPPTR